MTTIEHVLTLQKELENAIEHRDTFIQLNDWNMVKAWDEQLEFITEEIEEAYKCSPLTK